LRIRGHGEIVDVLAQCELHWLVGKTPETKVDGIRGEPHLHLRTHKVGHEYERSEGV